MCGPGLCRYARIVLRGCTLCGLRCRGRFVRCRRCYRFGCTRKTNLLGKFGGGGARVNRLLCGVRLSGDTLPSPGEELTADDKTVGRITSATFSPQLGAPLALAYIRRGHHTPTTKLTHPSGPAEVVTLPAWES